MGFDKLTADLGGKPVAVHSMLAFEQCLNVTRMVVVTREDRIPEFEEMARAHGIGKLQKVVAGGTERHHSVWNGIEAANATPEDYLAVHDAARPLITPAAIDACLVLAKRHGASACAAPISDTLKRATSEGFVTGSVERDHLWAMQTPQIFLTSVLKHAYQQVFRNSGSVTDEVSAVQKLGISVQLYNNAEHNFKITHPRDLELARLVLAARVV